MKLPVTSPRLGVMSVKRKQEWSTFTPLNNDPDVLNREEPYRIALYSHDTMGLGHIKRNILLAKSILKSHIKCSILLISGSKQSSKFELPYNAEIITLPSLYKNISGNYTAKNLDITINDIIKIRSNVIKTALKTFKPDVLIVDKVARGALKELDSSLKYLKRHENTRCILGLRDILDDPVVVKKEWVKYNYEKTIDNYYDYIWVYGDENIYDVAKEYNLSESTTIKIIYTGYLVKERPLTNFIDKRRSSANIYLPEGNIVLCILGGGQDGYDISKIFLKTKFPENTYGVLLTGPFMDNKERKEIFKLAEKYPSIYVFNFVPDPADLLKKAERIIAMGGYNTICELIYYGKKSLIIPRVTPRKEQLIRAECLSKMGLVDFLHPEELSPDSIAEWMSNNVVSHPAVKASIDLKGISRIPSLLRKTLKSVQEIQYQQDFRNGNYQIK